MNLFAKSAFEYMIRQLDRKAGSGGKLMFMMPSLPPEVVLEIGSRLVSFCTEKPNTAPAIIRVSTPLSDDWASSDDSQICEASNEVFKKGWRDDKGNLTVYRNLIPEDSSLLVF